MKLPANGQVGMSRSMAEMMLGVEIDEEYDEIVITMRNGELQSVEKQKYEF